MIRTLLRPSSPSRPTVALLAVAAVAVAIGGYEHYHLWSGGYDAIPTIGTMFLLNVIGSVTVVALFLARRFTLFALGAVSIAVGSIVGILLSRNGGLFGFQELGYDATATVTILAESIATVLAGRYLVQIARSGSRESVSFSLR